MCFARGDSHPPSSRTLCNSPSLPLPLREMMFVALHASSFAEAASACASATQLVVLHTCRMPALPQVLRPLHAGRWKRLLPHAWAAGAEPRHTPQGCLHQCVSAASRLVQQFCTRPPDIWGSVPLGILLLSSSSQIFSAASKTPCDGLLCRRSCSTSTRQLCR